MIWHSGYAQFTFRKWSNSFGMPHFCEFNFDQRHKSSADGMTNWLLVVILVLLGLATASACAPIFALTLAFSSCYFLLILLLSSLALFSFFFILLSLSISCTHSNSNSGFFSGFKHCFHAPITVRTKLSLLLRMTSMQLIEIQDYLNKRTRNRFTNITRNLLLIQNSKLKCFRLTRM